MTRDTFKAKGSPQHGPEWIMQVPVISTNHITLETNNQLYHYKHGDAPWGQEVIDIDGGWLLFVGSNEVIELPDDLSPLFSWTVAMGYEWLRLDQDADRIPDLPFYDW